MFDIRRSIKIFVLKSEVRYGAKVDDGFFPVFSVDTENQARLLTESVHWDPTDSLTTYARRLEDFFSEHVAIFTESQQRLSKARGVQLDANSASEDMASALAKGFCNPRDAGPSPIAQAIMGVNEEDLDE